MALTVKVFYNYLITARKIPVRSTTPNMVCMIASKQEISLAEANRITHIFIEKLREA
jgi:hypothetical protein